MGSTGCSRLLVDLMTGRDTAPDWGIHVTGAADNPFRPDRTIAERELDIL
jgi:hypothetical protein